MLISEKIGGLPLLSWVYDSGPIPAALIVLGADFGIICLLMLLEGFPPWQRQLYKTFAWNDTIFIPLYAAVAVVILQQTPQLDGFYTQTWWHVLLLILGFAFSFLMEWNALKVGQYTMSQELSPSKLWHTLIYGVMFYWLTSVLIPIFVVRRPTWAMAIVIITIVGFVYNCYRDATLPFPHDAHLEGSYVPWKWEVRKN